MIRTSLYLTITCDTCTTPLAVDPHRHASPPARFTDRPTALVALDDAVTSAGWAHHAGRLLCPTCVGRAECRIHGHRYAVDGWRACACDRSIPTHAHTDPDSAGGPGCGMAWRLCGRCDHIDERPITDTFDDDAFEVQPGGHLRQDVPAGLAPNHHQGSRENTMVGPTRTPAGVAPAPTGGGAR